MKKKLLCILAAMLLPLLLGGCAMLDKEYVSIHDYIPSEQEVKAAGGSFTVQGADAVKSALLNMVYEGRTEGTIVFDPAYEGEPAKDLENACWTVKTEDALCVFCVEKISYDFNRIVTLNEAEIKISYSQAGESPERIIRLGFSSEADGAILNALEKGEKRLTVLIGHSGYSAEDMAAQVTRIYRDHPTVTPGSPLVSVNAYSGAGTQRLYDMQINYGMSEERLAQYKKQMEDFAPFAQLNTIGLSDADLAYRACSWLLENCAITERSTQNSAYAALIRREANSEGIAFGYVELCRQLGLECHIVYGQLDWTEHCWNIVRVDGNYYHVDVTQCANAGLILGFMKNDEAFWGSYRWDVGSYPKCTSTNRFFDFFLPSLNESEK